MTLRHGFSTLRLGWRIFLRRIGIWRWPLFDQKRAKDRKLAIVLLRNRYGRTDNYAWKKNEGFWTLEISTPGTALLNDRDFPFIRRRPDCFAEKPKRPRPTPTPEQTAITPEQPALPAPSPETTPSTRRLACPNCQNSFYLSRTARPVCPICQRRIRGS